MKKVYDVRLTEEERKELKSLVTSGRKMAKKITRARILLLADAGKKDHEIAEALQTSIPTVVRVRKRFAETSLVGSLEEKPRPGKPPSLVGNVAAHITSLACSDPPEGHARWSLRLLADKAVELELVDKISHEAVRRMLKKTNSNRTSRRDGALAE
jgi:putative transposase